MARARDVWISSASAKVRTSHEQEVKYGKMAKRRRTLFTLTPGERSGRTFLHDQIEHYPNGQKHCRLACTFSEYSSGWARDLQIMSHVQAPGSAGQRVARSSSLALQYASSADWSTFLRDRRNPRVVCFARIRIVVHPLVALIQHHHEDLGCCPCARGRHRWYLSCASHDGSIGCRCEHRTGTDTHRHPRWLRFLHARSLPASGRRRNGRLLSLRRRLVWQQLRRRRYQPKSQRRRSDKQPFRPG